MKLYSSFPKPTAISRTLAFLWRNSSIIVRKCGELTTSINIKLPCQKHPISSTDSTTTSPNFYSRTSGHTHTLEISLIPYLRRLTVTRNDTPEILHIFFGANWFHEIGPLHESERHNYLFTSNTNSTATKQAHSISHEEAVPLLSPLQGITKEELRFADLNWNGWIATRDWVLGPRASSSADRRQ